MNQQALDLKDPDKVTKRFPAIRVRQPIGDIFVAKVDYQNIQQITFFDVRRRIQEQRDVERYLGIQRPLSERRVKELNEYVNYIDATFPTSIIVSVENEYGYFDDHSSELVITNYRVGEERPSIAIRNVGRVIDGQHRIAGLEKFDGDGRHFDVIVSFFVGSDIADQAHVFATVNLEQTKVNKSLAIDLFELARSRSPMKTSHNIAVALDQTTTSPFYHRIKRLGSADHDRDGSETLTQATFVNALVGYISDDPKGDRDAILRGKKLLPVKGADLDRLVFKNLFIQGDDKLIGKVYEEYFVGVRDRWPEAWHYEGTGIMLSRTNGYRAFASVFGKVYRTVTAPGKFASRMEFGRVLERVPLEWEDFNTAHFKPGSSGEADLRRILISSMGL